MAYNQSLVVVAPAALWPSVVSMNGALGYAVGDGVPLSANGSEPATHRALHTWAQADFVAIATGQVAPVIDGVTAQQIADLLAAITVSVDPVVDDVTLTKRAHLDHVLASESLNVITQEI